MFAVSLLRNKRAMAAAEARAAWQRTANRCLVQEDAKRAPKLACCSSSSSSKPQTTVDSLGGYGHPFSNVIPISPLNYNLPSDIKWWLQHHPNFTSQKDFTHEQVSLFDSESECIRSEGQVPTTNSHDGAILCQYSDLDFNKNVPTTCTKNESQVGILPQKAMKSAQPHYLGSKSNMSQCGLLDNELISSRFVDLLPSNLQKKGLYNLDTQWDEVDKVAPQWRSAGRDELASLVQQKLLDHIQNCDLPQPQAMKVKQGPPAAVEIFEHGGIFGYMDQKIWSGLRNQADCSQLKPACRSMEESCSGSSRHYNSIDAESVEDGNMLKHNPSKAQLLEALCHSQTRAREAENAAKQAYKEKEHILRLCFRQAYQLFAYKQWLRLLQLETICLQLKAKDRPLTALFPIWMPLKRRLRKRRRKTADAGLDNFGINKCAVFFVVGLSLVGAGLLLGWTLGWLLPGG